MIYGIKSREDLNMGCPAIYYKRALQCFANVLVYMEDKKLAKQLSSEEGCLFAGKCIMEEMEKLKEKSDKIDKNFDTAPPKSEKKAKII